MIALLSLVTREASANEFEDGFMMAASYYLADSWGEERDGIRAYRRNGLGSGVGVRGGALAALGPLYVGGAARFHIGVGGQSSDIDVGDHFWADGGMELTAQVGGGSEDGGVVFEFGPMWRRDSALGEGLEDEHRPHSWLTRLRADFDPIVVSLEWATRRHLGVAVELKPDEDKLLYVGFAAERASFHQQVPIDGALYLGGTTGVRGTFLIGTKY